MLEPDYIICHLVEKLPVPPLKCIMRKCEECKRPIWLSFYTLESYNKNINLICYDCIKNKRVDVIYLLHKINQ